MMNNKKLLQVDPSSNSWAKYVDSFSHSNIFHHPAWVSLLSECYGYRAFALTLVDGRDSVIAGLPMLDVNSFLTGRRWVSLPFTDYCQPLVSDPSELGNLAERIGKLSLEPKNPPIEIRWQLPGTPNNHSVSHFVQHTVNLDQDIELISKSLHRTQRQNIKTAEKNGIEIIHGENLEHLVTFFKLHCLTRQRQGVPVQPWRFFKLLFEKIIKQGNGFILLANKDGHSLAAGLFLNWHQTLCYKYAASDDKDQDLRPNHLLTWSAMNWGSEHGFKVFDFGRTEIENEGLRTFKCRWGAQETPLNYSVFSSKAPKPSSGKMMSTMNRIIKNSPMWVCQMAGELFYKHFG